MIGRSLVALSIFGAAGLLVACGDSGSNTGGGTSDDGGSAPVGGNNTGAGNTGGEGPQGGNAPDDCGNGTVDAGEECDGANLNGGDCESEGFVGGTLACAANCTFDTADCTAAECGDGAINGTEDCDGTLLGGATCMTEGFDNGTLACSNTCAFDTSGCSDISCGDGAINGAEECDGALLGTNTCQTEGFDGGTLSCTNCQLVTTACANENCVDAIDNEGDTLVDCADTDCTAECGDACNTVPTVADPSSTTGDTTGHADLYTSGCAGSSGPEVFYQTTAAVTGFMHVTLSTPTADLGIGVWDACANTGTEGVCEDLDFGGNDVETINFPVTAGQVVFLMIDGFSNASAGTYTLDVASIAAPVCGDGFIDGTEDCDDGNTVGGDACPAGCAFVCGDGIVTTADGEVCDDSNTNSNDGCNSTCTAFECAFLTCNDANACTQDACNATTGCTAATPVQPHDKCVVGPASTPFINAPGCTTGLQGVVSAVCAQDPFCCATDWDSFCVSEGFSFGESKVCPATAGTCSHTLCTTGLALTANCDSAFGDCVDQICAVDPFCCNNNWDGACVSEVASVCGLNCF